MGSKRKREARVGNGRFASVRAGKPLAITPGATKRLSASMFD